METKNKEGKLEKVRRGMKMQGKCYVNPLGISKVLALWWVDEIKVTVLGNSLKLLDVLVTEDSVGVQCRLFCVYGPLDFEERQAIWKLIYDRADFVDTR